MDLISFQERERKPNTESVPGEAVQTFEPDTWTMGQNVVISKHGNFILHPPFVELLLKDSAMLQYNSALQ